MLAPDKNVAITNMGLLLQANARAMLWARLMAGTVLPPLPRPPLWYPELNTRIDAFRDDAETWLNASGPTLFAEVSEATLRYGRLFASAVVELDKTVATSRRTARPMTGEERMVAQALVQELLSEARRAHATVRGHMDALATFQQRIRSRQSDLNFYRQHAAGSRAALSANIQGVEREVAQLRQTLAANEVELEVSQAGFATGTMGIIYAVTVAPVFAAGALSMGVALSVAGLGLTIWKLERYTTILRESSAKLNAALKTIRADEIEALMISCIIDNIATLGGAAEKAEIVLTALISVWQQTISDLGTLNEILAVETSTMDRYSNLLTLDTAAATWAQVMLVAERIQQIKFEITHPKIQV